jgi:uncharacterized membrane protein
MNWTALSLGIVMIFAGAMHFVIPKGYARTVPRWLPAPLAIVYISGVFEILGGAGVIVPATRALAAWGLIALFIAVFPANVNMAVNRIGFTEKPPPAWFLWARLPLQLGFIWWAWAVAKSSALAM